MPPLLDLDAELERTLDDVEAAPDFIDPPNGKYKLTVKKASIKQRDSTNDDGEDETKTAVNIIYAVVETVDVGEEAPVPDGSMFSENFQFTEEGLKYFKARAQKILGVEAIKGASIKQILAELEAGHVFSANTRMKTSKSKKGEFKNVQITITGGDADPEFTA